MNVIHYHLVLSCNLMRYSRIVALVYVTIRYCVIFTASVNFNTVAEARDRSPSALGVIWVCSEIVLNCSAYPSHFAIGNAQVFHMTSG